MILTPTRRLLNVRTAVLAAPAWQHLRHSSFRPRGRSVTSSCTAFMMVLDQCLNLGRPSWLEQIRTTGHTFWKYLQVRKNSSNSAAARNSKAAGGPECGAGGSSFGRHRAPLRFKRAAGLSQGVASMLELCDTRRDGSACSRSFRWPFGRMVWRCSLQSIACGVIPSS